MPQPVKVSDDLLNAARAAARLAHRSAAGQIEYWASLGRAVEGAMTVSQIAGLMQSAEGSAPAVVSPPSAVAPAPVRAPVRKPPAPVRAPAPKAPAPVPVSAPTPVHETVQEPLAPDPLPSLVAQPALSTGLASLLAGPDEAVRRRQQRVLDVLRQREASGRPVLVVVGCADASRQQVFITSTLGVQVGGALRQIGPGGSGQAEVDAVVAKGQSVVVASDLSDASLLEALRRWRQQGLLVLLVHLAGPATDVAARTARRFAASALSTVDHLLELEAIEGASRPTVTEAW